MRTFLNLALLAFLPLLSGSFTAKQTIENRIKGAWQIASYDGETGNVTGPAQFIKVYQDSTFCSYALTNNGSVIFVEGTYKIISSMIYEEQIIKAVNQAMIGKINRFTYSIKNNILQISGQVNAQDGKGMAAVEEQWIKVK